ncbi:Transcription factor GRAS [Dillenia turbinata]|uniref:Transcription factor GRAS n=1 Tax=Dillenia turbinata TaxID=194707 RepID=A0AAN8VNG2_9MAGN
MADRCPFCVSNPVQRVVFYFAEALRERIGREARRITAKGFKQKARSEIIESALNHDPATIICHSDIPLIQVLVFTGVQAILDSVASAGKVHIIDLAIRRGAHWEILMQALAERRDNSIQLLKITAIAISSEQKIGDTGKNLKSFSASLNLPFSFQQICLSDMSELREEHFNREADETIILKTMISKPKCLDSLMWLLRKLNPSIMVVGEIDANHNSTSFGNRFIKALFFYSAYFDCLEACITRDNNSRLAIESLILKEGIRNVVATEGIDRTIWNVKIYVWRAFFARFGMGEVELSESSFYQASLVVEKNFGTIDKNGKSLIFGWKGTPLFSFSAWKFICERKKNCRRP